MKVQSAVLVMAIAFGVMSGACSSGSSNATGTGGTGGASCSNVAPCGGNVAGTWTVTSSCLTVTGNLSVMGFGLGCDSAAVTGSLHVTGTWTANADGTYSDNTTTAGDHQIMLAPDCLNVSGTTTTCDRLGGSIQGLGYASVNCTSTANGGCTCSAHVQQTGGIGLVTGDPQASGGYTTASNVVTTDTGAKYAYCVSGSKMTWTPQSTSPTTTGTIVFQGSGTSGTGGTTGSGGTGGAGGASGMGGTGGVGGAGGSGGGTGQGGAGGIAGATGTGGATGTAQGPCDIYAAGNTPCVAAYSTVRRLSSTYTGPLYQVRKGGQRTGTGGTLQDIGSIVGGFADGAAQDAFCGAADTCTISILYDQSGRANNLRVAPAGCYTGTASEADFESNAKGRSLTVSGNKVYALFMVAHEGYRNNSGTGIPTGTAAQGIYEVADGKRIGGQCCWDFGNASTNNCYGPTGSMNAMYFGTGFWGKGAGAGPWFMGDFEAGVWSGGSGVSTTTNANLPASNVDYAFGILKTSTSGATPQYAIRVGNAQSGSLTTAYDGQAPAGWQGKGGIILGIGGDNSNSSLGTFFEGAMTAGRPSDATENAVLLNVQAAGYGR